MLTSTAVMEESKGLCRVVHFEQVNALATRREKDLEWGRYLVLSIYEDGQCGKLGVVKSRIEMADLGLIMCQRVPVSLPWDEKRWLQYELVSTLYALHPTAQRVYEISQVVEQVGQDWVCAPPVVLEWQEGSNARGEERVPFWQDVSHSTVFSAVIWPYRISA